MKLANDIAEYVERNFDSDRRSTAISILEGAVLHDGSDPDMRMLRSALASSANSLERLKYQVTGLAIDYRDVIVAGEYEYRNGNLIRVRDLSKPFTFDD